MPTYIQHDSDGNIRAIINTPVPAEGIEVDEALAASISPLSHYIVRGSLIAYTGEQATAKADQPRHALSWSNATMAWVMPSDIGARRASDAVASIASKRALLLAETDWVVLRAMESGGKVSVQWVAYRQALRDITQQDGYPLSIVWPERPEGV